MCECSWYNVKNGRLSILNKKQHLEVRIMKKLKKLFPFAFKYNKGVGSIILGAFLLTLIELAIGLALSLIIQPIIQCALEMLWAPISLLIGWPVAIVGVLVIGLSCGILLFIGYPIMLIGCIIIAVPALITSTVISVASYLVSIYVIVSCVIAVLSYAGVIKDDEPEAAIEAAAEAEIAE